MYSKRVAVVKRVLSYASCLTALVLCTVLLGCQDNASNETSNPPEARESIETKTNTPAGKTGSSGHAPKGFVPGSHEDWCGGHQVPESACTRCNSSLIPAFQAVGDWCGEHGVPESHCLTCNPDLVIERPALSEDS